eukprot:3411977-Amphidinium_carterae.1
MDMLSDELGVCFVRLEGTKTRRIMHRQHARVSDPVAVSFISSVMSLVPSHELIFGGSMGQFRRRWNSIFGEVLSLPVQEQQGGLTPA